MDFLRQSIDIIWNRIPVEDFIRKYLYSRESEEAILSEQYARLLVDQYRELTLEEAEGVERQLQENWLKRYSMDEDTSSFFHILIHFSHDMLRIQGEEPVCRFEHLLRWWETTQLVGPDLPATAYLAYEDVMHNNNRKTFAWPSVVRHDYALLNAIMQKGLTELHSHLNGASLNFDLQWLSLMNNVQHREKDCKRLEWYKFASAAEHPEYNPYSLYALIVMAAEMRRWLFEQHVLKHPTNLRLNKDDSLPEVGKIDASQPYYKRFVDAREETSSRVKNVRDNWARAKRRENIWRTSFYVLSGLWLLLIMIFGVKDTHYLLGHTFLCIGLPLGGMTALIVGTRAYFRGYDIAFSCLWGLVGALSSFIPIIILKYISQSHPGYFNLAIVAITLVYILICHLTDFRGDQKAET